MTTGFHRQSIHAALALAAIQAPCAHAEQADMPSLAAAIAGMPKSLPRAAAPDLAQAIIAAHAAVDFCRRQAGPVSVLIADAEGKPIVLLSGDGAGYRSALIAQTKANIVARYHASSAQIAQRAEQDPALTAQAAADPGIGQLRGGGLPFYRQGALTGIVAVSGASLKGGDLTLDESCARAGLDRLNQFQSPKQDKTHG